MIDSQDSKLFHSALVELNRFRQSLGHQLIGRFVQLFLAMKFYQNQLPSMFSNQFISTNVLQTLLDDLYAKASLPANACVLMLFENSYLARTGLVGPGNKTAQNTWRNNFNLQKGVGCYAPSSELSSSSFLNQGRLQCNHLSAVAPGQLSRATCSLCPTGARYRKEDHRKWLRIDPGGQGYAVVDLMNIANFVPYVTPSGQRIPLVPLVSALYHAAESGLILSTRPMVDTADFASDFNFSSTELNAYFDERPTNAYNARILNAFSGTSLSQIQKISWNKLRPTSRITTRNDTTKALKPPILSATPAPPPATNTGWAAEQYVSVALRRGGWNVYDVSRQQLGYDLLAHKGTQTRYVDAKSSLGLSSPSLTAREWQQAQAHGAKYVLAIIENFDPTGQNWIYWVPDPCGSCITTRHTTVQYAIPRSSWQNAAVLLDAI